MVLDRLISSFLPDTDHLSRQSIRRARVFVVSHLIGPIFAAPAALALFYFDQTPGLHLLVLALSIASFWAFPVLLRMGFSLTSLILLSLALVHFTLYWSCFFYGGFSSPTMIWVLIIPILGACYSGGDRTLRPYFVVLSVSSLTVFVGTYVVLDPVPNDIPSEVMVGLGWISTVAVLAYVASMAIYYARIFNVGVELEAEVEHRRALADELRDAVAAANHSGAAKTEFLARMSHELRNPLHSILGYGQLLRDEAVDRGDEGFLRDVTRILTAGSYLMRLVNMILGLAKLEAEKVKFDYQDLDVVTLLMNVVERYREDIEQEGNQLELDFQSGLGSHRLDAGRVSEILGCLLMNSSQHTRNGVISVSCSRVDSERSYLKFAVSDTGDGMPPDVLSSLFRTFPIKRTDAHQLEGTGLHLAIVGRLCAAMGGRIKARSVLGRGSTFSVTLPGDSCDGSMTVECGKTG